jgi:hypothetical protein
MDEHITYEEAMIASDSPTNLAWLINQNSPTARVDGLATVMEDGTAKRPQSDFTTLEIDAEMLDRPH